MTTRIGSFVVGQALGLRGAPSPAARGLPWACPTRQRSRSQTPGKARRQAESQAPLKSSRIFRFSSTLLAALLCAAPYSAYGQTDGATRADWPHYGGSQLSWRFSALDQINASNIKALAPA